MSEVKLINVGTLKHYNDKLQEQLANFALSQDCVTKEELNNLDFYELQNNPVVNTEDGKLLFADPSGYVGLQLEEDGLYVSDVIAGEHILSNKADKTEIPSLEGYATEAYVNNKVENIEIPECNLEGYATEEFVTSQGYLTNEDISQLALKSEIPSLEGYVHESELPDFDEFATTEDIPSLDGLATEDFVTSQGYLTEHQKISHLATKEELNNMDFNSINNSPFTLDEDGELNIVDLQGNVGMKLDGECLHVKDVVAGEHMLSDKINASQVREILSEYLQTEEFKQIIRNIIASN